MSHPEDERRFAFIPCPTRVHHGLFTLSSSPGREGKVTRRDVPLSEARSISSRWMASGLRRQARLSEDSRQSCESERVALRHFGGD